MLRKIFFDKDIIFVKLERVWQEIHIKNSSSLKEIIGFRKKS